MENPILILPGIYNSGPEHWQSLWEAAHPNYTRVMQRDWDHPVKDEWVATLEQAVAESGSETILVAHSMGCLLLAHWAASTQLPIHGALLVAAPDPDGPNFPADAVGFSPVPQIKFPFPSIMVASTDDPYSTMDFSEQCAAVWGSKLVNLGAFGHINASSGLGDWAEGQQLLATLAS